MFACVFGCMVESDCIDCIDCIAAASCGLYIMPGYITCKRKEHQQSEEKEKENEKGRRRKGKENERGKEGKEKELFSSGFSLPPSASALLYSSLRFSSVPLVLLTGIVGSCAFCGDAKVCSDVAAMVLVSVWNGSCTAGATGPAATTKVERKRGKG